MPVADARTHVIKRVDDCLSQAFELGRIGGAVDFEIHQRFRRASRILDSADAEQISLRIARDAKYRVDDRMDLQTRVGNHHANRIDQERRVVGDHFDERARRTVLASRRTDHAHLGDAGFAFTHEITHVLRQRCPIGDAAHGQFIGGDAVQKLGSEGLRVAQLRPAETGALILKNRIDERAGHGALSGHEEVRKKGGSASRKGYAPVPVESTQAFVVTTERPLVAAAAACDDHRPAILRLPFCETLRWLMTILYPSV